MFYCYFPKPQTTTWVPWDQSSPKAISVDFTNEVPYCDLRGQINSHTCEDQMKPFRSHHGTHIFVFLIILSYLANDERKGGDCSFLRLFLEIKNTWIGQYKNYNCNKNNVLTWKPVFILKFAPVVIFVLIDLSFLNCKEWSCLRTKKLSAMMSHRRFCIVTGNVPYNARSHWLLSLWQSTALS